MHEPFFLPFHLCVSRRQYSSENSSCLTLCTNFRSKLHFIGLCVIFRCKIKKQSTSSKGSIILLKQIGSQASGGWGKRACRSTGRLPRAECHPWLEKSAQQFLRICFTVRWQILPYSGRHIAFQPKKTPLVDKENAGWFFNRLWSRNRRNGVMVWWLESIENWSCWIHTI